VVGETYRGRVWARIQLLGRLWGSESTGGRLLGLPWTRVEWRGGWDPPRACVGTCPAAGAAVGV